MAPEEVTTAIYRKILGALSTGQPGILDPGHDYQ